MSRRRSCARPSSLPAPLVSEEERARGGSGPSAGRPRPLPRTRVALYARVSTKRQDAETQLRPLREYAALRGWEAAEYVDEGESGGSASRPALDRMMADAAARRIDAIAVWRFDRFARSTRHLVEALETFRALGVEFVSTSEAVDTTTPAGRVLFAFIAAMAEFERDIIRERVVLGMDRARAQGVQIGRPRSGPSAEDCVAARAAAGSIKGAARLLGAPVSTVRRRLREADGVSG